MRKSWLESPSPAEDRARQGWLGAAIGPLFGLAAGVYGAAAGLHRGAFERGLLPRRRLPCPVVSVGGLVVGGSGKTPLAARIASGLAARGHRATLATRGYGRSRRDAVHALSDGRQLRGDLVGMGDEPVVLAGRAPGVPVLVGGDRGLVGLRAVAAFDTGVLVLDDGFQHHRLHRDLDIVSFDGAFGFGNRRVLPRGPLRERMGALARADVVAVVDPPLSEADAGLVAQLAPDAIRIEAARVPVGLRALSGRSSEPVSALAGLRVGVLAALGQPAAFERTLEAHGATVVARRLFRDHHRYRLRDLRDLHRQADVWVTTEKDAVKILPGWSRADLRVLRMELVIEEEDRFLDWIEERIRARVGAAELAPSGARLRDEPA